jgi:ADP-heptose:LPS heptosyltransferase
MILRKVTAAARVAALLCIDTWVICTVRPRQNSRKALIVRLDAIGDFVLWLNAAEALASHFKAAGTSTVLVANSAWADWARAMQLFDEIIPVHIKRFENDFRYRYQLTRQIRASGYSSAIEPTYSRVWWAGDSIVRVSGAPERTGSVSEYRGWRTRISDRWFTRLLPAEAVDKMELIRNAEFVRKFSNTEFRATVPQFKPGAFAPDEPFQAVSAGSPYYVLFPGASWSGRRWPIANFCRIAERIWAETGWLGVIAGAPADASLGRELCDGASVPLLDWTGRTSLAQLASLIGGARLLVSNETSATHIAAATSVPSVCILGGGHYGRFLPYQVEQGSQASMPRPVSHKMPCFGCNWNCIYHPAEGTPAPCIEGVTLESIWLEIHSILAPLQNDC